MILLLLFLSAFSSLPSQPLSDWKYSYREFGYEDGLPYTLYGLLQSTQGYLYIATNAGLVRYDGREFTNAAPGGSVFMPVEDHQGKIWVSTWPRGDIYQFSRKGMEAFSGNRAFTADTTFTGMWDHAFAVLDDTLWITNGRKLYKSWRDTAVDLSPDIRRRYPEGTHILKRFDKSGGRCLLIRRDTTTVSSIDTVLGFGNDHITFHLRPPYPLFHEGHILNDGSVLMLCENGMIRLHRNGAVSRIPLPRKVQPRSLYEEEDGTVWVATTDGAYRYEKGQLGNIPPGVYFPDKDVNGVIRDREGNYWFSCRRSLIFLPNGGAFQQVLPDLYLMMFKAFNDRLWMLTENGTAYSIDSLLIKQVVFDSATINRSGVSFTEDLLVDRWNRLWLGRKLHVSSPPYREYSLTPVSVTMRRIQQLGNGNIAVGRFMGFTILDPTGHPLLKSDSLGYRRLTHCFYEAADGSLWIGADSGVYRYDGKSITQCSAAGGLRNYSIRTIQRSPIGHIVIGTIEAGVCILKGDRLCRIDQDDGLPENRIGRLLIEENGKRIWVTTTSGLSLITILDTATMQIDIANFSVAGGLPTNAVNGMAAFGGYIWLGTRKGICRFRPDELNAEAPPPTINITDVRINNRSVDPTAFYELEHDQNDLIISYNGVCFLMQGDLQYRYRIRGYSDEWITTTDRTAFLFSLAPGDYVFQVSAMNQNGLWNPEPAEVRFRISPHFTETFGFRAGMLILFLLSVGFITRRILINQRKKYATDAKIRELRQKMLSANMNPHFVFNVLNSIQSYMNRDHLYEANEFLARFSRLIRMNMEASQSSFVPLEEELERLAHYLALEKLRFGGRLDYTIDVDAAIDQNETMVPTMLVQPYVENAIWHGILPTGRTGLVEILVEEIDATTCRIIIRDNGVGISKAPGRSRHTSLSMKLNRERLELLSRSLKQSFRIDVRDRKEEGEGVEGTVVTLVLPRETHPLR